MTLPTPYYERDGITIYVGDNRDVLPHIEPVHAVVTDPPSGISFMGKEWDSNKGGRDQWIAWLAETLRGVSDAMLPGAHALIWALPRTSGWTSMAIEDAGLDVRDCITHLFGSGFPKSHDVSKAIDKMAGAEREVVGTRDVGPDIRGDNYHRDNGDRMIADITAPATPEAEQWQGWGTALKPAAEFWYLARKPFKGTVAANVLKHSCGAINIDASRIPGTMDGTWGATQKSSIGYHGTDITEYKTQQHTAGRWPANVILDEESARLLDAQSGVTSSKPRIERNSGRADESQYRIKPTPGTVKDFGDTGGASRFFYVAKASRRERNAGLDGMPEKRGPVMSERCINCGKGRMDGRRQGPCCDNPEYERTPARGNVANHHPTVKPIALMRYLIQMITPPGGIVLDPFAGSGSTLVAAAELGFHAIGIELSEEYAEIAARRVDHALNERAKRLPGLEVVS